MCENEKFETTAEAVQKCVGLLCTMLLDETHKRGESIIIPSLGIVIPPTGSAISLEEYQKQQKKEKGET